MQDSAEILNSQAIDLASRGDYPEAIACFISALKLDRENYLLWFNLGVTYRDAGQFQAAKDALIAAHNLNSEDDDILDTLSLVCYALNDMEGAFKYLSDALAVNPYNPHLWNNIGVLYFSTQEYQKACEAFEHAVSLFPHYYDALYNLRDTYSQLGNKVGATECRRRMKELNDLNGAMNA